jgi:hypothetical protein
VLSELLQNADDAGATRVKARVFDKIFEFRHNGEDFNEETFRSLCQFGFSNKRHLHTIGFRGVGFKSIFSLGPRVQITTPTLTFEFRASHFTEPIWSPQKVAPSETVISVELDNSRNKEVLESEFKQWLKSPIPLIFFSHIEDLEIQEQSVKKENLKPGPLPNSHWIQLTNSSRSEVLFLTSEAESFPEEALEEIREERGVQDFELPPCTVTLVFGNITVNRVYTVLPTVLRPPLPFSFNAPFVQDPARDKIKEPANSSTNRWLLKRIGKLAGESMLCWLKNTNLPLSERVSAYRLLPEPLKNDRTLESEIARLVLEGFWDGIPKDRSILVGHDELLTVSENVVALPNDILATWEPDEALRLFQPAKKKALCHEVNYDTRKLLKRWDLLEILDRQEISERLCSLDKDTPKCPKPIERLAYLWRYLYPLSNNPESRSKLNAMPIVPVANQDTLFRAPQVSVIGGKKSSISEDDWVLLINWTEIISPDWREFIAKEVSFPADTKMFGPCAGQFLRPADYRVARDLFETLNLNEESRIEELIEKVRQNIFKCAVPGEEGVRLALIAAKVGASISEDFKFLCCDGNWRAVEEQLVALSRESAENLFPDEWVSPNVISFVYENRFSDETKKIWDDWIQSADKSKLNKFPLPTKKSDWILNRKTVENFCESRGRKGPLALPLTRHKFYIEDFDWPSPIWSHWKRIAEKDPNLWVNVVRNVLRAWSKDWEARVDATVVQEGSRHGYTIATLPAEWLHKLKSLPCLPDTFGRSSIPVDLLRRSPKTEALLDVEAFVKADFDVGQAIPLLTRLGVRDTPTGPTGLLERLRALARATDAPLCEIEKWYHRLDQIIVNCSTEECQEIRHTFRKERITLSESNGWVTSTEVFLEANEEDVPGVALVHPSVKHLALWQKIGIAARPTIELVLGWFKAIPSGKKLDPDELRRVRSLLARHAERIWEECEHWLNLEGEWIAIRELSYKLTMQSLIPWANLFQATKRKTADFQRLSAETCQQLPFSKLPSLAMCIEERIAHDNFVSSDPQRKVWMQVLGTGLSRILLDDEKELERIRMHGLRLAETVWQLVQGLETVPYIDGAPAGLARKIEVLWKDTKFYVEDRQVSRLFKAIATELARPFDRQDISDAVKACVERPAEFVTGYVEENFTVAPLEDESKSAQDKEGATTTAPAMIKADRGGELGTSEKTDEIGSKEGEEGQTGPSDQETGAEEEGQVEGVEAHKLIPEHYRAVQPKFIEVYAKIRGYIKEDNCDRFTHTNGSWLQKSDGGSFPWEKYSADGRIVQSYWLKQQCLEKQSIDLDVDVWSLCQKHPDQYTLILADSEGHPIELPGKKLVEMVQSGRLILYPAGFRLAYEEEHG